MNNIIQEPYISFEIAKLLKEKNFDVECDTYITEKGRETDKEAFYKNSYGYTTCPTHALAIMWIRENFGFHICTYKNEANWNYNIFDKNGELIMSTGMFDTPEEAEYAAILYTLQNLIK